MIRMLSATYEVIFRKETLQSSYIYWVNKQWKFVLLSVAIASIIFFFFELVSMSLCIRCSSLNVVDVMDKFYHCLINLFYLLLHIIIESDLFWDPCMIRFGRFSAQRLVFLISINVKCFIFVYRHHILTPLCHAIDSGTTSSFTS